MQTTTKTQGHLVRSLGLFSATVLVISSIIGSGIFKKVAPMSAELQSPGLVLFCWLLAGIVSLFGALSNAEVASLLADAGGEYVYFRTIYGRLFAFLYGWSCFAVIRSASIASIAYVFAQSLNSLWTLPTFSPEVSQLSLFGIFQPFDNIGVKLVAIILICSLTWVNYKGLRFGEGLSNIVTGTVVACIVLIVIAGLTIGGGSFTNIQTPAPTYVSRSWTDPSLINILFTAMLAAFWGYEGWSSVGYMGGEIKNPNRNIPLALTFGVLGVILIYLAVNFTYLYVLPVTDFIQIHESKNTIAAVAVVKHFWGTTGALLVSILILIATFGCTNTTALMASRLYYKMANQGLFFRKADYIHPVYNTPSYSLLIQAFWASMLVLSGSFDQLTDMLIFASFIFYGATTLGVFVLRYKMPDTPRPYKVIGYPVIPALFIIFCIVLIANTLIERPREAGIGLFLILTGLPFYFYWTQNNKSTSA
ncbi:amino acid permease [Cytophagaceae bacterium YF14B1]|uniref:Amino acid permease n=1 Tax=Xanthocytophaga flava TaxID=3048013 RepID=A0AAE3U678_9BACT|nr:amino acid permease [Xanthocytophaga flavus]MDJ1481544.1 amino acid permease [Xanthocytophaga flavus]